MGNINSTCLGYILSEKYLCLIPGFHGLSGDSSKSWKGPGTPLVEDLLVFSMVAISVFQLKSISTGSILGSRWEMRLPGAPSTHRTALQAASARLGVSSVLQGGSRQSTWSASASHVYEIKTPGHFHQEVCLFLQSVKSWSVNFWTIFIPLVYMGGRRMVWWEEWPVLVPRGRKGILKDMLYIGAFMEGRNTWTLGEACFINQGKAFLKIESWSKQGRWWVNTCVVHGCLILHRISCLTQH